MSQEQKQQLAEKTKAMVDGLTESQQALVKAFMEGMAAAAKIAKSA